MFSTYKCCNFILVVELLCTIKVNRGISYENQKKKNMKINTIYSM